MSNIDQLELFGEFYRAFTVLNKSTEDILTHDVSTWKSLYDTQTYQDLVCGTVFNIIFDLLDSDQNLNYINSNDMFSDGLFPTLKIETLLKSFHPDLKFNIKYQRTSLNPRDPYDIMFNIYLGKRVIIDTPTMLQLRAIDKQVKKLCDVTKITLIHDNLTPQMQVFFKHKLCRFLLKAETCVKRVGRSFEVSRELSSYILACFYRTYNLRLKSTGYTMNLLTQPKTSECYERELKIELEAVEEPIETSIHDLLIK